MSGPVSRAEPANVRVCDPQSRTVCQTAFMCVRAVRTHVLRFSGMFNNSLGFTHSPQPSLRSAAIYASPLTAASAAPISNNASQTFLDSEAVCFAVMSGNSRSRSRHCMPDGGWVLHVVLLQTGPLMGRGARLFW